MEENKMREVYRAIYGSEIDDFTNKELLSQKEHMKKSFCENSYNGKNDINYDKILEDTGVDNPDESFLFFFKDKDFAEKYAKGLSNNFYGEASVVAFQFDEGLLEKCKGTGYYENINPNSKTANKVEEYAVPLSLYDPQKNLIGPLNNNAYHYDPDNYSDDLFF